MGTACFRKAPQQFFVAGHQEQHFAVDATALEFIDQFWDRGDLGIGIARIETDGSALIDFLAAAHGVRDERLEQRRRNIVNAVIAQILKHVQCHALAGSG